MTACPKAHLWDNRSWKRNNSGSNCNSWGKQILHILWPHCSFCVLNFLSHCGAHFLSFSFSVRINYSFSPPGGAVSVMFPYHVIITGFCQGLTGFSKPLSTLSRMLIMGGVCSLQSVRSLYRRTAAQRERERGVKKKL